MKSYNNQYSWREVQYHLPDNNRIDEDTYPAEKWWKWKNQNIHLDHYINNQAKAKIILLHGVGGNGRLLSFIAVPLYKRRFEVICPDLSGYGLTECKDNIDYNEWVTLVKDLVSFEENKDSRPIILFGLSAGGMLAYHAACNNDSIDGLIFSNLLDQRIPQVRDSSASNKFVSKFGIKLLTLISKIKNDFKLPIKFIVNMNAIVNNASVRKILLKDKTSSGSKVTVGFIISMINYQPEIEFEHFNKCPVLMVHPEKDNWTDLELSMLSFEKLGSKKTLKILNNAGHFPIESPGLQQLEKYVLDFILSKILHNLTLKN